MGSQAGLGVTHLAIALADYTAKRLHARTALAELGERNTLANLWDSDCEDGFSMGGVSYYPSVNASEFGYLCNMNYEYMILDLGQDSKMAREELLRCNVKLIVGSLNPWRKHSYYEYIKRLQENSGTLELYTFLALFADKIEIKKCRRTFKAQVKSIPFIADPFCPGKAEILFLHSLL